MNKKILAVASAGGHWSQLLRILPAFEGHSLILISTKSSFSDIVPDSEYYSVNESNRWNKIGLVITFFQLAKLIKRIRPEIIITTGAAPGLISIIIGRIFSIKTIWIDSIANAECISLSGKIASIFADMCFTQWPDLENSKFKYYGNILS